MKILVIHGPNLNLLGTREPEIYGDQTLDEINDMIASYAKSKRVSVVFFQSNHEGEIIDRIQAAGSPDSDDSCDAIIINPGAYTHYSLAIRDAIQSVPITAVEVHLSNLHSREEFRRTSVIAPVCRGQITGFGPHGYRLAVDALLSGDAG
jgi:3-dehydroquinate dehydratase-2